MPRAPRKIIVDPAEQHNQEVLEQIKERDAQQAAAAAPPDVLGLGLLREKPKTAGEYFRDEFDRKNFGDRPVTYTRVIYGPDSLLIASPWLKDRIEEIGLEEFAELTAETIKLKGAMAMDDPLLRKNLAGALREFGVDEVAEAFKKRILKIPKRTVDIEADRDDDEMFGKPLEDAVRRYGNPGMAPKFLSERCIAALGLRGYRIVMDEHGDPVKVGTLIMGEIPEQLAERRRQAAAQASRDELRDQEEAYRVAQARFLSSTGSVGVGSGPLASGDTIVGAASERESLLGERLDLGVRFQQGTEVKAEETKP